MDGSSSSIPGSRDDAMPSVKAVFKSGPGGPGKNPYEKFLVSHAMGEIIFSEGDIGTEMYIVHEGKKYAWTIPLSLPVTAELARTLKAGQEVALTNSAGAVVATLTISDVFPWDKLRYLKSVYGTERTDHPGADMVLKGDADKTHLIGGTIRVLPQPKHPAFGKYVRSPAEVRGLLAERGWKRVVAFQTRNPLHRAHEYALVYGLETLVRQGHDAGAVLNPLIG